MEITVVTCSNHHASLGNCRGYECQTLDLLAMSRNANHWANIVLYVVRRVCNFVYSSINVHTCTCICASFAMTLGLYLEMLNVIWVTSSNACQVCWHLCGAVKLICLKINHCLKVNTNKIFNASTNIDHLIVLIVSLVTRLFACYRNGILFLIF